MHTVEAVIAIAMIAVALITLFKPIQPIDSSALLVQSGYAALQHLTDSGMLRPATHDIDDIRTALQPLLSNFELEICDPECSGTSRNGAAALDYFVAGYMTYDPVHLRLYVW